jgi:hypothetical protein
VPAIGRVQHIVVKAIVGIPHSGAV